MRIARGTIVSVGLNPTIGHEQRGMRPCVAISNPEVSRDQRYPLICVVPISATPGQGALYPRLEPRGNGLKKDSYALVDQLRRIFGEISRDQLAAIDEGLTLYLGISSSERADTGS
jgi:mRNA-degrading endonuclease toxin of MazEF toxin-antitoxin module